MKIYIDFNAEKKMNTANNFEKDFFKLIINSVMEKQWRFFEKESV